MMVRAFLRIVCALALGVALVSCGRSTSRPTSVFAYDRDAPLDVHSHALGDKDGVAIRSITYAASDGEEVPGYLAVPVRQTRPGPCLIYQGGIGMTAEQAAPIAEVLGRIGIATFAIEARFTGSRGGTAALERALSQTSSVIELLRGTVLDLRRGIDYLDRSGVCDPRRIGFAGVSFGGLIGTMLTGVDTRVRAAVLMSIGGDFKTILERPKRDAAKNPLTEAILSGTRRTPQALAGVLRQLAPYEPTYWVSRISPRPVLFVNGRHDPDVSVASALMLQSYAHPKQVFFDTGGHIPFTAPDRVQVYAVIARFLQQNLVGSSAARAPAGTR